MKILRQKFSCDPTIRSAISKAGPCITDNGNMIIDADFGLIKDPTSLEKELKMIPGIVETGLFVNMTTEAYFGLQDGKTKRR